MQRCIVLVISLRRIERLQRHYLGHDRAGKRFGLVELRNVRLGNALLIIVAVEDGRAILRAFVRTLTIQLRRIKGYGEEHLQNCP